MQVYQDSAYDLIGAPLSAENKGETLPRIVLLDDVRLCGCYLTRRRRVWRECRLVVCGRDAVNHRVQETGRLQARNPSKRLVSSPAPGGIAERAFASEWGGAVGVS